MNAAVTVHGGVLDDEIAPLGLAPSDVLDFSVNVNPYGPCDAIRRAANAAPIERYPDPSAGPARRAISRWLDVPPETVLVASGAVEVLWSAARAKLDRGDTVAIAGPAFSEMRAAAERVGAQVVEHRSTPERDFAFDARSFGELLEREAPRLAYIASPANPSGVVVPTADVVRLADEHPATQLVVDISFLSLCSHADDGVVHRSSRALWVRSLTKELSVPGLRIGFAVGPPGLVASLAAERPPWSVSAPAQAVTVAATTGEVRRFVDESRAALVRDREGLTRRLTGAGLAVHPSEAPYVLVHLGPAVTGAELRRALLARHGILIRDAASFGLPHHVRIAARPAADVGRLLVALEKEIR